MHSTCMAFLVPFVLTLHFTSGLYKPSEANSKDVVTNICVKTVGKANVANFGENDDAEDTLDMQPYQKCENTTTTNYCFTLWEESRTNSSITILRQGCWVTSEKSASCEHSHCIANGKPSKAKKDTKFCCCMGDLCNSNFTYLPCNDTFDSSTNATEILVYYPLNPQIWILSGFLFILLMSAIVGYIMWQMKPSKNDAENIPHPIPPPPDYSLDKLKLCNIIGRGRYGCVWRGVIEEQEVAVKVFPAHHRNYFLNEYNLYKVAADNVALLKFYGGGERILAAGGPTEYLLILNLEQQCLQEYLKNNTVDLAALSKMSLGVAKGLAHLHSDVGKPCIAHRDLNTRNILVKSDLSCCICDLGLAVVPKRTENRSLSEAGTLRYMPPEVLEGAVNLRDCECALKQIDVYALGLVLWELGVRCTDMQNSEPSPYAPPFYKEVGENATLEQMQSLVSRRKARPLWPPSWKDTAAARLLAETAEDCWDQDAEARLTSLCVEERLLDLPILRGRILHPLRPPASPTTLINNNHLHNHVIDSSVGTIETLLSPTEEHCKNSNQLATCVISLQPYQGRNPCLERNLLSGSSDSLLIDKSSKHCASSESQNLISNDFLSYQINPRAMPIPYLQNAVHDNSKQCNTTPTTQKSHKFRWPDFRKLFNHKSFSSNSFGISRETQVKLRPHKSVNNVGHNGVTTSLLNERPSTLPLKSVKNEEQKNFSGVSQILKQNVDISSNNSFEHFNKVFSSTSDLSRLKDPSQRVKTPGDVPPSVRRTRGKAAKESARFSLYDDRIMCRGQWGSAPYLEQNVPSAAKPLQADDLQDRESISSF